jgi:hypothetical protein
MTNRAFTTDFKSASAIYWLIFLVCLTPWFYLRVQQAAHSDMLWLGESAMRLLDGNTMSGAAYDPNPPLSILIYIFPALLQKFFALPLHIGVQLQAFAVLAVSSWALIKSLMAFPDLSVPSRYILVCGYLLLNTLGAALTFGERDQLIGMILPPLVAIQLGLTRHTIRASGWIWVFCMFAALLILLKPPHGLLPTLLLLHRFWCQRSFGILRDPDFVSLSAMTVCYAGAVWFFFRDYIEIILPDMLRYYYPSASDKHLMNNIMYFLAAGLSVGLAAHFSKIPPTAKRIIILFSSCAMISLISVAVQMKGYYYHYLPALTFMAMAALLLIYEWLLLETRHLWGSIITASAVGLVTAYAIAPLDFNYPRHHTYMSLPLPALVAEENRNGAVYIFNDSMSLSHEIPYYANMIHASRFPSLWFLPGLYHAKAHNISGWEQERDRYASMVAEDLNTYKPGLVLFLEPGAFDQKIDPLELFAENQHFQEAWAHYSYVQSTTVDEGAYFGDAVKTKLPREFRIYRRKSDM